MQFIIVLVMRTPRKQRKPSYRDVQELFSFSVRESPPFKEIEEKVFQELSIRHFETTLDACVLGRSDSADRILNEHLSLVSVPNAEIKLLAREKIEV